MIGEEYCSSSTLSELSDRFGKHDIMGKKANITGELDQKFGKSHIFKAIVTGDKIQGERKFG